MPKIKRLELKHWMKFQDQEDHQAAGFPHGFPQTPKEFPLIGRNGYYRCGDAVWFEWQGMGYQDSSLTKIDFDYKLRVNDEAILSQREASAMRMILRISRDPHIRKVLWARIQLHNDAADLRRIRRGVP